MIQKILLTLLLSLATSQATFALENPEEDTHSDEALCRRASQLPNAKHVVCLEAEFSFLGFRKTVYTGSAVCIGPGEYLTNAHCLKPWYNSQGQLRYPVYVKSEEHGRQALQEIFVHELYLNGNLNYDIAYCRTQGTFPGLGINPDYRDIGGFKSPYLFDIIGYGAKLSPGSTWGRCDGQKRAIVSFCSSSSFFQLDPPPVAPEFLGFLRCPFRSHFASNGISLIPRDPKDYEEGFRSGMSGGGAFLENSYVGIPTNRNYQALSFSEKAQIFFYEHFGLKLVAIGISTPYARLMATNVEAILPLAYFQTWIEEHRIKKPQ